jgi:hypothetical protein
MRKRGVNGVEIAQRGIYSIELYLARSKYAGGYIREKLSQTLNIHIHPLQLFCLLTKRGMMWRINI